MAERGANSKAEGTGDERGRHTPPPDSPPADGEAAEAPPHTTRRIKKTSKHTRRLVPAPPRVPDDAEPPPEPHPSPSGAAPEGDVTEWNDTEAAPPRASRRTERLKRAQTPRADMPAAFADTGEGSAGPGGGESGDPLIELTESQAAGERREITSRRTLRAKHTERIPRTGTGPHATKSTRRIAPPPAESAPSPKPAPTPSPSPNPSIEESQAAAALAEMLSIGDSPAANMPLEVARSALAETSSDVIPAEVPTPTHAHAHHTPAVQLPNLPSKHATADSESGSASETLLNARPVRMPDSGPAMPVLGPGSGGMVSVDTNDLPSASGWGMDRFSVTNYLSTQRGVSSEIDLPSHSQIFDAIRTRLAETNPENRYILGSELARGGMGAIRILFDKDIRRDVAMKVILGGHEAPRDKQARFLEEAQITGQLEHPNIVPVHELGIDAEGSLYFTMKLVRGESLLEVIENTRDERGDADRHFTLTQLLQVFLKICDAVAFAHAKGVIHRDLKPENVMVGDYGEVLVMDWGLSKVMGRPDPFREKLVITDRFEDGVVKTLDGSIVGTPGHMPPEQARGEIDNLDERSDIYALGCILYEILTYEPPFPGNDVERLIRAVRRGRFIPPSRRAPWRNIPRELEEVVTKAMAFDKDDRYQSVTELKGEIEAFLDGRTLASVHYTPSQLLVKWVRRHLAAALVGLISFVVLSTFGGYAILTMNAERNAATAELNRLKKEKDDAVNDPAKIAEQIRHQYASRLVAEGEAALFRGDLASASRIASQLRDIDRENSLALRLLAARVDPLIGADLAPLPIGSQVRCMAIDSARERLIAGTADRRLLLVDLAKIAPDQTMPVVMRPADVTALCVTARNELIVGDVRGMVTALAPDESERWVLHAANTAIQTVAVVENTLLVVDDRGRLTLWRLSDRAPVGQSSGDPVTAVAATPALIAFGSAAGRVQLSPIETAGRAGVVIPVASDAVRELRFDPSGRRLIARSNSTLAVFDVAREPALAVRFRYRIQQPDGSAGVWIDEAGGLWIGTATGIECRDLDAGVLRARFAMPADVSRKAPIVGIVPTAQGLIAADSFGDLFGLADRSMAAPRVISTGFERIGDFAISYLGDRLAMIDGSTLVEMRAGDNYRARHRALPAPARSIAFGADDRLLVLCADGTILVEKQPNAEGTTASEIWFAVATEFLAARRLLTLPDTGGVVLVGQNGDLTRLDLKFSERGAVLEILGHVPAADARDSANGVAVLGSNLVVRADAGGGWHLVDVAAGAVVKRISLPKDVSGNIPRITAAAAVPTGQWLLLGDESGHVFGFQLGGEGADPWLLRWAVDASALPIRKIVVHRHERLALISDAAGELRAWAFGQSPGLPAESVAVLHTPNSPHGAVAFGFAGDRLWLPLSGHGCPLGGIDLGDLLR